MPAVSRFGMVWVAAFVAVGAAGCGADVARRGDGCAPPEAPRRVEAVDESVVLGDVDGNGRKDRVAFYEMRDTWRVRLELGAGWVADHAVDWDGAAVAIGATDVDGDGREEVWFPANGATAHHVGIAVFAECRLREVTDANGDEARFLYAATGNSSAGWRLGTRCRDAEIVEWSAHADGTATSRTYELRGSIADLVRESNDTPPGASYGLDCQGVTY